MYQALVLVVLFYAALAACQGIPMPGARNPPPARPRPSPVANPAEVARILHNHCTRFFIESPDLSTRPGSSGSTSSSDSDILVISGGRGGRATRYTRRAEDTPPAMLLAVCRRSDGQWRRVNLNLNRCFGWDRQGMRFTVQPK
ncbi:hypothetical protein BDV28DRAFT_135432 [Aspergillus coremiiformis]|uniref:Cyanovirin-N domain-containing protein n=1 Tax=Aspergillus coremiiformis TaxID=138285 RepID=A0A5N6Z4B9_9EURO|nr:hypothetical protein BDV28DRAFT_135432 [Aspergillus coremiiformis]